MIIDIQIFGEKKAAARLVRLGSHVSDISPVGSLIGDVFRNAADKTFSSQGRRGGGSWKRLAPETIRRKARLGLDPRIEHATLLLRNSLTQKGHPQQVLTVHRDGIDFGSSVKYARNQDRGSNVPKRPLVKLVAGDISRIKGIILDWIVT